MSPPVARVQNDDAIPPASDVVIIGGGIAGVSAAYALAKAGHSVALLEKGVIAGEQSSRNWGWVRQQNRDLRELPLAQRSLEIWGRLNEDIGTDTGFRRTGILYCATDQAQHQEMIQWNEKAREHQFHSNVLTAEEARRMSPGSTGHWVGGIYSPTDGRAEPGMAGPAIAEGARKRGATIHQQCAARGIDVSAGRVSGVVTEKGLIRTSTVLLAGGAWSSMFCRRHSVKFPAAGVRATSFYTKAAPEVLPSGMVNSKISLRRRVDGGYTVGIVAHGRVDITPLSLMYIRDFWTTFRKKNNKGLTIRVGTSFLRGPETFANWDFAERSPFETVRVLDPEPEAHLVRLAMNYLIELYPELEGIEIAQKYGGLVDFSPDWIPVISPVDSMPGLYISAGFSGHGFGIGPGAGQLAADLIIGNAPLVDPTPYRYSRLIDGTPLGLPGMM